MPRKVLEFIQRLYDEVEAALWALLVAGVLFFATVVAPKLPVIRAQLEAARIQEIAHENDLYCEKWGMAIGTARHGQCVIDLNVLRNKSKSSGGNEF